jgi:predicted site-specific integrase-resolvase
MNPAPDVLAASPVVAKLAYNAEEACAALGIKRTTLWRLESRGLITACPHVRHKLYAVAELQRFLSGKPTAS